jgi:hypothetical protein
MSNVFEITFIAPAQIDEQLKFKYYALFPDTTEFDRDLTFKTTRSYPGEVTIGADAYEQAQNYYDAFVLDYLTSDFTIVIADNIVTITCMNGSDIFDAMLSVGSSEFALLNVVTTVSNNVIHVINLTPKKYVFPAVMAREYLVTENGYFITTEDGKKIRI